jgi:predicted ATP-dependent protease
LRQDIAVTGSVNQHGQIQPVGGVIQKIEGFFDVCRAKGLTGSQGVLIPAANRRHLMLRDDVVAAVTAGQFHIWTADEVDAALELLTGSRAESVHEAVVERLNHYAQLLHALIAEEKKPEAILV